MILQARSQVAASRQGRALPGPAASKPSPQGGIVSLEHFPKDAVAENAMGLLNTQAKCHLVPFLYGWGWKEENYISQTPLQSR